MILSKQNVLLRARAIKVTPFCPLLSSSVPELDTCTHTHTRVELTPATVGCSPPGLPDSP